MHEFIIPGALNFDEDTNRINSFIDMGVMLLWGFSYATMHVLLANSKFQTVSINFPSERHIRDIISSQIINDK